MDANYWLTHSDDDDDDDNEHAHTVFSSANFYEILNIYI